MRIKLFCTWFSKRWHWYLADEMGLPICSCSIQSYDTPKKLDKPLKIVLNRFIRHFEIILAYSIEDIVYIMNYE